MHLSNVYANVDMGYHIATLTRRSFAVLAFGVLACSAGDVELTVPSPSSASVRVTNDGTAAMSELRVLTSDRDSIPLIATLNAGQTLGPFQVSALHSAPYVQATVQGRELMSHPVEGFSGFNPALAAGAYVVRLRVADGILDVRVAPGP